IITINQPAQSAQNRTFFAPTAPGLRRSGGDASSKAAQRQRLQPDSAGTAQRRQETNFPAEKSRFDFPNVLDVVVDGWLESHDTPGVDANGFARRKIALMNCS